MSLQERDRGAASVEFALLLPLLMVMLLGIIEFGYAFFLEASVAGAARVGVRHYAVSYNSNNPATSGNAADAARAMARAAVPDPGALIGAYFTSPCSSGSQTTFVLSYRYHSMTGLLDSVLGSTITLTGKGSMQCGG